MVSQRQLRVGEEIRHALAAIVNRGDSYEAELLDVTITVTEVRISPDLRNATVFVMPLAGKNQAGLLAALKRAVPHFRKSLAREVKLRYVPELRILLDESFDYAGKIGSIINTLPETDRLPPSTGKDDEQE